METIARQTFIETEEKKSKSQIKLEMLALQELGEQLIKLPDSKLDTLPMPESLIEAVLMAKRLKREALRRQLQHIGGLMRQVDAEPIRRALETLSRPDREETRKQHEVEGWRDRLLEGDGNLLEELASRWQADRQHLRQLVRNAGKERERNKPPKSARTLFRYLMALRKN